jgi:hypothetical protein
VARMKDRRGAYKSLVGRRQRNSPHGKRMRRWDDNIRIFKKWDGGMDLIDMAQDRDR